MAKKFLAILMVIISIICIVYGGNFIKKSGVFAPYPETELLSVADSVTRPVYEQLDETEKAVYSALYNGISEKKTEIPLPCEVSGDVYSKVYCIFEKQEGGFFYIDSTYYTAEKIRNAQIILRESPDTIEQKMTDFESSVDKVLANAPDGDYEKALYIHDYIAEICHYNTGDDYEYSSTAYGCLAEGQANCEGYAKAFCYLARRLDMKCILITGKTDKGENHAWNQIEIDGDWYNLDVTWDDMDISGSTRRAYFLCDDKTFGKTHIAENNYFSPFECTSDKNNYYVRNGLFAVSNDEADTIIRREVTSGKRVIELKFADSKAYADFKNEYIENQKMFDVILECGYISDGQIAVTLRETEEEYCVTLDFS
ncbi:MAG: hypothetical protein NC177_02170 [Ruminococcus flavefaciens]|nr:hypothetical protein [Ruminococcus flavefaciens]